MRTYKTDIEFFKDDYSKLWCDWDYVGNAIPVYLIDLNLEKYWDRYEYTNGGNIFRAVYKKMVELKEEGVKFYDGLKMSIIVKYEE